MEQLDVKRITAEVAVFKIRASHSQSVVRRWLAVGIVCAVALLLFGIALGGVFKEVVPS
jgi:hypothetical protein